MIRSLVTILAATVAAGCGIPVDSEPQVYDEDGQDAIEAAASPPTVWPAGSTNGTPVDLYFVADNDLTAVRRNMISTEPWKIVQTLIGGPTETEMRLDFALSHSVLRPCPISRDHRRHRQG